MSATTGREPAQPAEPPARELRADARRNVAAILDAALRCLARDPDASVGDIAQAAGVGRVTLYGHFKSRADLIDAVLARTVERADAALDATDTTGDPRAALTRLVASSWEHVDHFRSLLPAAQRELPADRIRSRHDRILRRVQALIERGRRAGAFRTDLPARWLISTCYGVMHAAAEDCASGRLDSADAARVIAATLVAAFTPPGEPVPAPSAGALNAGAPSAG
ncbi:MAG TPA: TetR/AcrR family transcriptional regulator [Streptosporangiaceae bacterium]|nr:TetR/AcrR family transcriptional regulator [Streptosporangiaceae bacterium]